MKTDWNSVMALWQSLPEAAMWGRVERIRQCMQEPELVLLFGPEAEGELYAVLDVEMRRVVEMDEFPCCEIEKRDWVDVAKGDAFTGTCSVDNAA